MATSLQHPCHPHALNLRELSQNSDVECFLCEQHLCGSAYCCLDCDIYLHESCARLTLRIQHPSHPKHSLNLSRVRQPGLYTCDGCNNHPYFSFIYGCHDCMFALDVACAVSTLPPPEGHRDEEVVWHFAHDHPLALFHMDKNIRVRCKACNWKISGPAYGCRHCLFLLHDSCAQLPREIPQHPLHDNHLALTLLVNSGEVFQCKACEQHHQFTYCCSECEFNLCTQCAFSTLPLQDQQREDSVMIQHISHSHELTYFSVAMDSNISCKACYKRISGEIYACVDCIFFLHKPCAELPQEMVHSLHPHPLYLEEKPHSRWTNSRCWCCNRRPSSFFYSCQICPFNLDIECTQKTLAAFKEQRSVEIHHPFHQHPLVLHLFRPGVGLCTACQDPIEGLGYQSKDSIEGQGNLLNDICPLIDSIEGQGHLPNDIRPPFQLHISCAGLPLELEHPCHPKHLLKLTTLDGSFTCDACNRESKGCAFSCVECFFHLEVDCASKKPSLKHQLHEHGLIYFQRTKYLQCNQCDNKCNTDLYRCVDCNFNLHHGCVPLPLTAKHELHIHPLLLRDRVVDEFYDEHYCDLCETLRNPDHGVYYCEECNWAAHIDCVIPRVEPKGDIEVQNPLLSKLDEEIASLKADMKEMKIKLEALQKKRAGMISLSLIGQEDGEKPYAFHMKLPEYPSGNTLLALEKNYIERRIKEREEEGRRRRVERRYGQEK